MRARPAPPSERVRVEWLRRVEAEYGSAAIAQHLGLWLVQIGASADLVHQSQRAARDELAHAAHAGRVYAAAGGEGTAVLQRERLGLVRTPSDPLELDVARACVVVFCLGETVAVRLFAAMRAGCTAAPARVALDRVLRDEVRHRDLGWTLLGWLLDQPGGAALRSAVVAELPAMFLRAFGGYAHPAAADDTSITAEERAWGLLSNARYAAILERSIERDHVPRFARLGIDASNAWASARPARP